MKTIDKLLERIKKEGRSIGKLGKKLIVPLTLTALLTVSNPRAEEKSFLRKILDRTSIEASYSHGKPDPLKDFYSQLNEDWRNGKYTSGTPITDWKNIESPKNIGMLEGKLNFEVWKNKEKNLSMSLTGGIAKGSASTSYDEKYTVRDIYYGPLTVTAKRKEDYKLTYPSVGAKVAKQVTDKLIISSIVSLIFCNVKGNANLETATPELNYTQWRQSQSEGKATGFSAEAGVNYSLGKNVKVGAGFGYTNAKVQTSGIENVTTSTGGKGHHDYNPTFNLNGVYGRAVFRLRF